MAVYKVSFVVIGSDHPGAIVNRSEIPRVGEMVTLGSDTFEVTEVMELMPPRGQFYYIHATARPLKISPAPKTKQKTSQ